VFSFGSYVVRWNPYLNAPGFLGAGASKIAFFFIDENNSTVP
jgi:hypothetical protein